MYYQYKAVTFPVDENRELYLTALGQDGWRLFKCSDNYIVPGSSQTRTLEKAFDTIWERQSETPLPKEDDDEEVRIQDNGIRT